MKVIKPLAIALVASTIFAAASTKAAYRTYSNIDLPALSSTYSDGPKDKERKSYQSIHTIDARDNLSNDTRAIQARTKDNLVGSYSSWINANIGTRPYWSASTANGHDNVASYNINLRATKSTLSKVSYWGTWDLDNYN